MGFHLERLDLNSKNLEDFLDRFIEIDEIHQSEDNPFHSIKIADFLEMNLTAEAQEYSWDLYSKENFMRNLKGFSYIYYQYESKDGFENKNTLSESLLNLNKYASVKDKIPFVLYPNFDKRAASDTVAIDEEAFLELSPNQTLAA